MTKKEVQGEIESIINVYVMNSFGIVLLKHPYGKEAKEKIFPSRNTTVGFGRKNDSSHKIYQIEDAIVEFDKKAINNQNFLLYPLMSTTILIHDLIKANGFLQKTPEFEFFRHIRNAFGHGNKFTFRADEPKLPAKYKKFVIEKSLDGKKDVMIDFIKPGDVLDLIEYIVKNI